MGLIRTDKELPRNCGIATVVESMYIDVYCNCCWCILRTIWRGGGKTLIDCLHAIMRGLHRKAVLFVSEPDMRVIQILLFKLVWTNLISAIFCQARNPRDIRNIERWPEGRSGLGSPYSRQPGQPSSSMQSGNNQILLNMNGGMVDGK